MLFWVYRPSISETASDLSLSFSSVESAGMADLPVRKSFAIGTPAAKVLEPGGVYHRDEFGYPSDRLFCDYESTADLYRKYLDG